MSYAKPLTYPIQQYRDELWSSRNQNMLAAFSSRKDAKKAIASCLTLLQANESLTECAPYSVVNSVALAAEMGLTVGGGLQHGYLVPFWNKKKQVKEVQLMVGYKGLIFMAVRDGIVDDISCQAVYKDEAYRPILGTSPSIHHIPHIDDRIRRVDENVVAVYAIAYLSSGRLMIEHMTVDQTSQIRKCSKAAEKAYSPWTNHATEMRKKTVIHRLFKKLPVGRELARAIDQNNQIDDIKKPEKAAVGKVCLSEEQCREIKDCLEIKAKSNPEVAKAQVYFSQATRKFEVF